MATRNLRCFSRLLTNYSYQNVPTSSDNRCTYYVTKQHSNKCNDFFVQQYRNFCLDVRQNDVLDVVKNKAYSFEMNRQKPSNQRFIEYENMFAFDILKEKDEYRYIERMSLNDPDRQTFAQYESHYWQTEPSTVIDELLNKMDSYNNNMIINLLRSLVSTIPYVQNEKEWARFCKYGNFALIWKKLHALCEKRLEASMSHAFINSQEFRPFIEMANLWFELGLSKKTSFSFSLMTKLIEYEKPLCNYSFLQLMFLINLQRSYRKSMKAEIMAKTEAFLMQNRDENGHISLRDLTLVAMGFFKTKTRMNLRLLELFLEHCQPNFDRKHVTNYTISVTSILKTIRYSFDNCEMDYRPFRAPVRTLVNSIIEHPDQYMNSAIVSTHLILLLNGCFLQEMKQVYKLVLDKMVDDLENMRIKDIERVLFCLANADFKVSFKKLKKIEVYVTNMPDATTYPTFLYSIYYYLRIMGYVGRGIERLIIKEAIFQKTMETLKENSYETMFVVDTTMRLLPDTPEVSPPLRILTEPQIQTMKNAFIKTARIEDTKHARFLQHIKHILEPKFGPQLQFMHLFPHTLYPFPVILNGGSLKMVENWLKEQQKMRGTDGTTEKLIERQYCLGDSVIPYDARFVKAGLFNGCKLLYVLLIKDFLMGESLRGSNKHNIRLLEVLGFRIHFLPQYYYRSFILPKHFFDGDSKEYMYCVKRLLYLTDSFV